MFIIADGRVVSQLGATSPVQGKFMGLVSTGLGFTVETGSLSQTFCIPSDKTHLRLHWKFYSEEFKEYCGSQFQDDFEVSLTTASGEKSTIIRLEVDDLCFYSEELCDGCPEPMSCDFECMGTDGCTLGELPNTCEGTYGCECGRFFMGLIESDVSFDKGGVFSTTWQTTDHDLSLLAGGEPVTLRISTSDTGDSIFDTAVLVDGVEVY